MNAQNKVIAINNLAILVVTYCLNIIDGTLVEIKKKKMDTKVRQQITFHRMYQPRADIEHLCDTRENRRLVSWLCFVAYQTL